MLLTVTLNPALDLAMDVPGWAPGEVHRARRVLKTAGGKGINMARVLRELGEATTAVTILGSDSVQEFRRLAREAAVPIIYINIPGEIRTNIHLMDPETGRSLKVNQPGTTVLPSYFEHFRLLFRQQLKLARWVAFGGSLPPGLPPDSYALLSRMASEAGVDVLLDTEGPALLEALPAKPKLVKPNRRELESTLNAACDNEKDIVKGIRELQAQGARGVFVSNGGDPAVVAWEKDLWRVIPPAIEVQGTTGAGDSSAAGLLSGLRRGLSIEDSLRYGAACGTACCLTPEMHLVRRRDVEAVYPRVRIERIKG